jgi:hypothetical protein
MRGVRAGEVIEYNNNTIEPWLKEGAQWIKATVLDPLSTQFTVDTGEVVRFCFYKDYETTWRKLR